MRIKSMFAGAVLALGVAAFAPSTASAQVGFVVQGSYGFDVEEMGVGAGVNLGFCGAFCDGLDNSEIGINVLGGYKLGTGKAAPFVQARFAIGGAEQLYVTGGFRF
ncbi:MAG: hypothetical protein IPP98_04740 [Gemmatimonadetes bacterium]|nr:hypothetical protein [Gemmatimonadota bacterium]